MVIPVGPQGLNHFILLFIKISSGGDQYLVQVDKDADSNITTKTLTGVRFVPLTSRVCAVLVLILILSFFISNLTKMH